MILTMGNCKLPLSSLNTSKQFVVYTEQPLVEKWVGKFAVRETC